MANLSNGVNIYMIINKLFCLYFTLNVLFNLNCERNIANTRDVLRRGATRCVIVARACVNL